ncbi:MAG: autotransporter-associated beta strand repeat-containing protein [Chthoniobacter sp.]
MILANPSFAQTTNWIYTGTDPGAWDTAGNWDHGVPGLDSLAQFGEASTSGSLTTTLDFGTAPVGYREVGAISLSAAATQKHTLQSSTAGELRIDGSDTTIDETPVTLLFGNFASAQTLVIQGSGAVLTLSLYDSGVIDTVGQITLAGPIVDGGGVARSITKTGAGVLRLSVSGTSSAGNSTYSGGLTLKEGTVELATTASATTASAFGTGTPDLARRRHPVQRHWRPHHLQQCGFGRKRPPRRRCEHGGHPRPNLHRQIHHSSFDSTLNVLNTTTWYQTMSGAHSLTKTGDGTLILQSGTLGSNFTGGFTLQGGAVFLNASGAASGGAVTNGAFGTGTLTLRGGTLNSINGVGRLIYNNVDLGGNITLGDAVNTGAITFAPTRGQPTLSADSTLNVLSGVVWAQAVSGAGSLTKTGAGTLSVTSSGSTANTYSGGFALEDGVVQILGNSSVSGGVLTSGPFGTGTLTLRGGRLAAYTTTANPTWHNAVILNGNVELGSVGDPGTMTFSSPGGNTTTLVQDSTLTVNTANVLWQQGISGGYGLTKAGTGNLTLAAGSSGTYTGPTTVAAGALYVDGFLFSSPVEVQSGATFGGAGQVNNTISVLGGGTLAPGSRTAVGTLSTAGALSLESGAHIQFDLSTATSYDALAASSPVSLDGADLVLTLGYQPSAGDAFVLIENNSGEAIDGLLSYEGTILHDGDLFSVTSGGFTQEFQIDYDYEADGFGDNLAITALSVPEPSTWGLLAWGPWFWGRSPAGGAACEELPGSPGLEGR